jgi:hypothetical protein
MAGISAATATAITLATTAVSTAMGVYSSIAQAKQQSNQAKYQSAVAKQNQQLAEEQASAERREGYENMIEHRRKVAGLISKQRASTGASGAVTDFGSTLDIQEDTAAEGEMDALKIYQQGLNRAYGSDIQAANYGSQAKAYDYQASSATKGGWMNAAATAIGGIADMGSTWSKYKANNPDKTKATTGNFAKGNSVFGS